VIQTDALLNTSAASAAHTAVTIDTTAPGNVGASFTNSANATVTLDFSETVTALGYGGLDMSLNPNDGNSWAGTPMTITGVSGLPGSTVIFTTSTTLVSTDYVRVRYSPDWGGTVTDLAGNPLPEGEIFIGGSGASTIDLDWYGNGGMPVIMRGNGGADTLIGTSADDVIIDGGGADTLSGGKGADIIRLVENGTSIPYAQDIVKVGIGDSTNLTTTSMDVVMGSSTSPAGTGFDVTSATPGNHDILNLQSNVIAGNATDANGTDAGSFATHTISSGIVSFKTTGGSAILVNQTNAVDAVTYLATNITTPGTTVAFEMDTDNNGSVDSLVVFQDNGTMPLSGGYVLPDTLVVLAGVTGATLGTTEGNNVVQLQDTTEPNPIAAALISDGFALNFAENAYATTSVALTLQKNGTGTVYTPTSIDGSGTTSMAIHYSGLSLADTDWAMFTYAATGVSDGVSDVLGNAMAGGTSTFAEGGSGNNTIDLSSLSAGYDINGNGGNDTLIGSSGDDWLSGGTGADTMTGGGGSDSYGFAQGDSPLVTVNLGGNGILDNGDTFTFAGGLADRIMDFVSNEGINLNSAPDDDLTGIPNPAWMGAQSEIPSTSVLPTNGLATDQSFYLVQGNYNGTTTFTVTNVGVETLVVYDGDSTAGVTQTGLILSGVTLAQLETYTGNNWIGHLL
jgi:hypothetical protein